MRHILAVAASLMLGILVSATEARSESNFFEGKTIRFIASSTPGGGTDTLARLISRHYGRYIPGHPDFIVMNMPGAGGMIAANYLYNRARPDGLTMSSMNSGLIYRVATKDKNAKYKYDKFTWLGQVAAEGQAIYVRADTPFTSFEAIKKASRKPKLGSKSRAHSASVTPKVIEQIFDGVEFQMVYAYPGTAEVLLDIERGALDGRSHSIGSFLSTKPDWLENGFVKVLAVSTERRDPRLPDVPTLAELTPENKRQLLEGLYAVQGRWYAMPPGVPPERAKILRDAFFAMVKDEEFLREGKKMGWNIEPMHGETLQKKATSMARNDDLLGVFRKALGK